MSKISTKNILKKIFKGKTDKKVKKKVSKKKAVNTLIFKNWIWIDLKVDSLLKNNEFRVFSRKRKKDVTNEV